MQTAGEEVYSAPARKSKHKPLPGICKPTEQAGFAGCRHATAQPRSNMLQTAFKITQRRIGAALLMLTLRKGRNESRARRRTQPEAMARESRHARGHRAGHEAPVVTAASPRSRHGRRHSRDMGATRAHADTTWAESSKHGRGLPFTRSSACSCNNCCCRISNCLCSSSNCRLMYSWRCGQQGSKEKEREGKRDSISQEEGKRGGHPHPSHTRAITDQSAQGPFVPAQRAQDTHHSRGKE